MDRNEQDSGTPIWLSEEKFNALQKKAHYQVLIHTKNNLFFVPVPKLATTFSHQVVVINENTGIPEQVYYNQITQIVVDGKHYIVQATLSDNHFLNAYRWLIYLFFPKKTKK